MLSRSSRPQLDTEDFLVSVYENEGIAPAYIFVGSDEGTRLRLAVTLAKILNCCGDNRRPCNACTPCKKIDSNTHPDVRRIEMDAHNKSLGIDEIRAFKNQIALKPYEGKIKVFIINKAHLMNQHSSNAILKTLEEPPGRSVIILLAESVDFMLRTIISRCQIVRLPAQKIDLSKTPETLEEELVYALALLRDALVFKVTQNKKFLFNETDMKNIKPLSQAREIPRLESDIKKLIELRDSLRFNANPKIVRDVFSNTMRRYKNV